MKVHVFAPNIVIDITYCWFEAGQKLDRDRTIFAGPKMQILQSLFFCSLLTADSPDS